MKIPTILGLALLFIAGILGAIIFHLKQKIDTELSAVLDPKKIRVVNLTDTSAAITWQTYTPSYEWVEYGIKPQINLSAGDDRDWGKNKQLRLTHFATVKNLSPDTEYIFKISSEQVSFPQKNLTFKTSKQIPEANTILPPVRGSVIDSNINPIDEALVFLKINGASDIAGFTTTAGNFIIPLKNLYKEDMSSFLTPQAGEEASLIVSRANLESNAKIILPPENRILPPIIIGENQDLRQAISLMPQVSTISAQLKKFDLNNDNQLNSLDASIMIEIINNKRKSKEADFNGDRVINQKDLDILSKALNSL